jgi:hypothetical protein
LGIAKYGDPANRKNTMKTTIKYLAPWLAAAAISGAIALAPVASANTDPLVPPGANPHVPYVLGAPISPDGWQSQGGVDLAS